MIIDVSFAEENNRIEVSFGEHFGVGQLPESYSGEYTITPKARESQTLLTKSKLMTSDVVVLKIPTWQTSNQSGQTFFIAE